VLVAREAPALGTLSASSARARSRRSADPTLPGLMGRHL
jgi:hypothetical protein